MDEQNKRNRDKFNNYSHNYSESFIVENWNGFLF
jgi:hypothetical protein